MARVRCVNDSQAEGDTAELLARVKQTSGEVLNVHRTVARCPAALRGFLRLGTSLLARGRLPPNLRELAILRIARMSGADYEWAHHVPLALRAGVREAQVDALSHRNDSDEFSSLERTVLAYAEAVVAQDVSDEVFDAVRSQLGEEEVVELTLVCGYWHMVACFLLALKVDLEPAAEQYLPK